MPTLTDVEAQRKIDETISEYEAAILELKTRRNTHSAISKLPTELTANIFLICRRAQDQSRYYAYNYGSSARNGLNVSGVCRQWRAIVLDSPRLWCFIDLSWEAQCVMENLRRSKSVPLQVRCTPCLYDNRRFDNNAKVVMLQNIRELDVRFATQDSLIQFMELNPSYSAPTLEILRLCCLYKTEAVRQVALWHDMLALRILELDNIPLLSPLPMLPRLTRLLQTQVPSSSWLVQSLRNTPLVEEIKIYLSEVNAEMSTSPRISLPKLASLSIVTDHLDVSNLFQHVDYPASAVVSFICSSVPDDPWDFSGLHRFSSQFSASGAAADLVRIDVAGTSCFFVEVMPSAEDSLAHLTISLPTPLPHHVAKYVELCATLPLATIHHLALVGFDDVPITEWLPLFPRCQQLTTLYLTECSVETVKSLLTTDDAQNPPFEKLETLVLSECIFDCLADKPTMCDALISILNQRKRLGMPIRKLKVEHWAVTTDIVEELEGYVEVDWGNEEESEEEM